MYRNSSFIYILLVSFILCGCEFRGDGKPVLDDIRITVGVDETQGYMYPRQFYHIELIMHFEGYRGFIRWSPDGEWIGFIDEFLEEGHIFVKHIPTNTLLELTKEKVYNEEDKISWFPDSRRIAFSTRLRGSEDLWVLAF